MRDQQAMLRSTTGETMTLEGVSAQGRVRGLLFELDVEQRYRNPGDTNIEAIYTFPLPVEAVLLDLDITLNGRKLVAKVVEKKAAERDYEQAIDKGDTAIMLERAGDGLCTLNLGNLMAGERATIRYRYAELLRFEHGSVRLAVPTVIAPRYGDPGAAGLAPHQVPTSDVALAYPFTLAIDLEGPIAQGRIASPSHALAITATAAGMHVELARGAFLDRDFVLNVAGLEAKSLAVVARDGERFVALASFCANVPREATERPLAVKLLVDCSGSMGGDSIDAAKRALHRILASLEPGDRFSYSRFGSHVVHETKGLVHADANAIRSASALVGRTDADLGGTEMEGALQQVFALGGREGAADVLLLTDGEIWNADHLIAEARGAQQRVFVVGIGSAPAEGVLRRLAEATGGACEFVAPNEDAEGAILRMFARLRAPRVERADIAWPAPASWTTPLPQGLFGGETIHAFAGFDAPPSGAVTLALHAKAEAQPLTAAAELGGTLAEDRTLARIAASRRMATAGADEKLELALAYGLLSAQTNLIVVHERAEGEKAADLPQLAHVAQMHAAGWHGVGSVVVSVSDYVLAGLALRRRVTSAPLDARFVACERFDDLQIEGDDSRAPDSTDARPSRRASDSLEFDKLDERASREAPDAAASIDVVLARIEAAGMHALPATFADLRCLGVPADVVTLLIAARAHTNDEKAIVRALLGALADWDADGRRPAILSRHTVRVMRRGFSFRPGGRALVEAARRAVEAWARLAIIAHSLPSADTMSAEPQGAR